MSRLSPDRKHRHPNDVAEMVPVTLKTLQVGNHWLGEHDGGLERFYFELLRHLPETGTGCRGLVVGTPEVGRMTNGAVVAFATPNASLIKRLLQCRRVGAALGSFDLISVHFGLYGLPWLDHIRSMPSVIQFQGSWAGESGAEGAQGLNIMLKQLVESKVYDHARRFLVLSKAFQQELTSRYRIDESRIRIVPGGVDIQRFNTALTRQEARERLGWPENRFIALSIRRQVRRMGLENLIEATKLLRVRHPELLVLLGGSGPLAAELQQRIDEHGLANHVMLLGRVTDEDLPLAYRAADVSVVPTHSLEGFGLITVESMASGTPVLVTPVGGLPETILPFAPECVFPDTSTAALTSVLGEFLDGVRKLPSSDACRAYAVAGFSWPRVARMVRDVYDEAVG